MSFNTAQHSPEDSVTTAATMTPQIENIFFVDKNQTSTELSTKRFGLDAANFNGMYNEFLDGQHIYVRKSVKQNAADTWGQYKDKLEYKIPLSFSTTYSTFSREFYVDMSADNWSDCQGSTSYQGYLYPRRQEGHHQVN